MAARRSNKRKRRNRGRFGILYQFLSLVIILVVIAAGCVVFSGWMRSPWTVRANIPRRRS